MRRRRIHSFSIFSAINFSTHPCHSWLRLFAVRGSLLELVTKNNFQNFQNWKIKHYHGKSFNSAIKILFRTMLIFIWILYISNYFYCLSTMYQYTQKMSWVFHLQSAIVHRISAKKWMPFFFICFSVGIKLWHAYRLLTEWDNSL